HLDCDFCSLPWDSSRLSKLQSIQIRNLTRDLPSIAQLGNILAASPQLQWLLLASWSDDSHETTPAADASKGKQVAESSPPSPVHLPSLETLVLQNVPRDINDYLLTHIHAPACTCLIAGIRPASLRSLPPRLSPNQIHPSNTFADLLSPAISAAPDIMMSYEEAKGTFRIYSSPEPEVSNEWIHWVKRKPGINFLFHTDKTPEIGSDLRHALSGLNLEKATTLNLIGDGANPSGEVTVDTAANGETTSSFPVEALQALPQVTQLFSARNFRVGDVLKHLGRPLAEVSEKTDGGESWPLPQLSTLSLSRWRPVSDAKGMLDEILQFGLLRKGDMDRSEDDWVGSWPKPLERLVVPPEVAQAFKEANSTFDGVELSNSNPTSEIVSEDHLQLRNLPAGDAVTEPEPTLEQLDAQLTEIEQSQHAFSLDSYRLKRERNALVPLHRLPGEIFVSILLTVGSHNEIGLEDDHKRLHALAQVSTYWFDTIIAFPSFWQQLAQYHPPGFREMVLKRNTSGLLKIDCVLEQAAKDSAQEPLLSFMKMVAPLSERWKVLTFEGDLTDEIMELLQSPAPNLDSLLISSWGSTGTGSNTFELGEGRNIWYLDVDNMAVPWNSSRLRGLRGVQIQDVTGILPSLEELYAMLAASPELWWLQLSDWSLFDGGGALMSEVSDIQIRPIMLPLLTSIILHNIPAPVTQFLLSSITAPTCQCVIVQQVPSALLNNPSTRDTFAKLVNGALAAIPRFILKCRKYSGLLSMVSEPRSVMLYNWIDHVDERPGLNVHIPTEDMDSLQLGPFLSSLKFPDDVEFMANTNEVNCTASLAYAGWHRVPKLKVSSALAAEIVSRHLSDIPQYVAWSTRLRSLSAQFSTLDLPSGKLDSIVRNLVAYVEQSCSRKNAESQLEGNSKGEPYRQRLEINMPRAIAQKLGTALQDWDVRLSEIEPGKDTDSSSSDEEPE
ncbi:hypothetical protein FRC00_007458, partial [Tulasnella sp. 408]